MVSVRHRRALPPSTDHGPHVGIPVPPLRPAMKVVAGSTAEPAALTARSIVRECHGVPEQVYRAADRDYGLYYITKREEDKGKFRTPTLREVDRTAPYLHNGVFFTLEEVIDFYDQGGGDDPNKSPLLTPLHLTEGKKKALLTVLESLSGDEIIVDPPTLPPYKEDPLGV